MWKGEKLRLSAWLNETKAGKKYIKGTVSEPYEGGKSNKKQSEDF
jgi:hypothetical protein